MLLIRHAQSEWNEVFGRTRVDPGLPDPPLTADGVRQAEIAAAELARLGVRRLVSSPYRRALQTASILAARLGAAIEVEPLVRERCAFSCDQGTEPALLARDWPELDLSQLPPLWWGGMIESHASLARRCAAFRERVRARTDWAEVAVVSHWGFIRCLTGLELANAEHVRLDPGMLGQALEEHRR